MEMFELLLAQRQAGVSNTLGRLRALEMLSADGLWQDGFDLQGANLEGLRIPFGRWRGANFSGTVLRHADGHGADLAQADFSRADLTGANLRDAASRSIRRRSRQPPPSGAAMRTTTALLAILAFALGGPVAGQSLDLGAGGFGLSIGNSERWSGLSRGVGSRRDSFRGAPPA